jgi:acyl-coenzyme A synthetase/AMP-(fatty) acid ligase
VRGRHGLGDRTFYVVYGPLANGATIVMFGVPIIPIQPVLADRRQV